MPNNSDKKSPTQEIIDKCKDILCDEIIAYKAENDACKIKWEARKEAEQYKVCCFVKAQQAYHAYTNLDLLIAARAKKEVELISGNVKTYNDKDAELAKILSEAVKSIKDVKKKLAEVADEACKLDRCLEEEKRCNPDLKKALEKGVPRMKEAIENIKTNTKECYELSSRAFDGGVEIVGIQSFTNLESLKKLSNDLAVSVGNFKADMDQNIKKSFDDMQKCKEEYINVVQELEQMKFDKCAAEVQFYGLRSTRKFICDPHCEECDDEGRDLEELCRKVKKNFDDSEDNGYDCDDDNDNDRVRDRGREYPSEQEQNRDWSIS